MNNYAKKIPRQFIALLIIVATVVVLGFGGGLLNKYLSSPASVRQPVFDHYHFRTVLSIDGKPIDFGQDVYQQNYIQNQCDADLTAEPIHFHDQLNQFTHIHWDGMTGGLLLKNYGWNFIGGNDNVLGWRFDESIVSPRPVSVHANALPEVSEDTNYYVYIKTNDEIVKKSWQDFIKQDFEEFFGQESSLNPRSFSALDFLFTKASAHGGEDDGHAVDQTIDGIDKAQLNNLLGDLAIFVQSSEPTDEQVRAVFNTLVSLPESTCSG